MVDLLLEENSTGLRSLLMPIVPHSSFKFFSLQGDKKKNQGEQIDSPLVSPNSKLFIRH